MQATNTIKYSSKHNNAVDSSQIRLLNWNIFKGKKQSWASDLKGLTSDSDLVLLQEALLVDDFYSHISDHVSVHVAQGFVTKTAPTGVLTAASAPSLRNDTWHHPEPFLRTSKSALITEYRLSDTSQTLLVANIHSINFSLGTVAFSLQLTDIFAELSAHPGPVLLAGDFNTWRAKRMRILSGLADDCGLQDVAFAEDGRKQVFRRSLDHVFYRGLQCTHAEVIKVSSSDHNPIQASFTL